MTQAALAWSAGVVARSDRDPSRIKVTISEQAVTLEMEFAEPIPVLPPEHLIEPESTTEEISGILFGLEKPAEQEEDQP